MPLLEEFTARRIQHGPRVLLVLQGVATMERYELSHGTWGEIECGREPSLDGLADGLKVTFCCLRETEQSWLIEDPKKHEVYRPQFRSQDTVLESRIVSALIFTWSVIDSKRAFWLMMYIYFVKIVIFV
jgi:hypothetical protein